MALGTLAVKDGNSAAQTLEAHADAAGNKIPVHSLDGGKPTYRFAASFTPYATAALTLLQIKGSATKTVRVKRILVGGDCATASGSFLVALQRTSTSGTGGTAVTPTAAPLDSAHAAASAVVTHFTTAAQSNGSASGGPLSSVTLPVSLITSPDGKAPVALTQIFPEGPGFQGQSIVLRGTGDFVELQNKNGGNLPGTTHLQYVVELEEDAS